MASPRQETYDLFTSGTFWDLALIFGFSNMADGDSLMSTPQSAENKVATPFSRAVSSPLGASFITLPIDDDDLSLSRNMESISLSSSQRSSSSDEECCNSEDECCSRPKCACPSSSVRQPLQQCSTPSASSRQSALKSATPKSPAPTRLPYRITDTKRSRSVLSGIKTPHRRAITYVIKFCSPTPKKNLRKVNIT